MTVETLTEEQWERKLKIRTRGGSNHAADGENFPYEPTPYSVLLRLAQSGRLARYNKIGRASCRERV